MQNLNQTLTSEVRFSGSDPGVALAAPYKGGALHAKSNYIPDFVDNTGLCRVRRRACSDAGHCARPLYGTERGHAVGYFRTLPQGTLALAGTVENESGTDQESAPDLSWRHHRARPQRRECEIEPGPAGNHQPVAAGAQRTQHTQRPAQ